MNDREDVSLYNPNDHLEKLDKIEKKIHRIDEKLAIIMEYMESEVVPSTNKMSSHIDFIEHTYTKVSAPLHFVCNKINRYISHDNTKKDE